MNEYEYYDKEKNWNFDYFDIETEKLTNWHMYEILRKITNKRSRILDLGTGGGEKLLKSFPKDVEYILGTDYSEGMIETANKNLKKSGLKNIEFRIMDNLNMDVADESFDVVVARNTVTNAKQIYKALKTNGYVLIHGVDKYDCHSLKMTFGRGQAFKDKAPISIRDYEALLSAEFHDVELVPLHVREYFKDRETLKAFLEKVPILESMSEEQENQDIKRIPIEDEKLDEYIKENTTKDGKILLLRRYYGIIGRK